MNDSARVRRALIWKEARQVMPLVYMLLGVTLVLLLLWGIMSNHLPYMSAGGFGMVLLMMPAFYAAGVGAILIGQEKETETIRWVGALPIDASGVFRSKIIVSAIGLALTWVATLLGVTVTLVDGRLSSISLFPDPFWLSVSFWIIHSVYLMMCGHFTSWRCKSVFTGLAMTLAIACVPYVLAQITVAIYQSTKMGYATDIVVLTASGFWSLIGIGVVSVLASRAARNEMSPTEAPVFPAGAIGSAGESPTVMDQYRPPVAAEAPSDPYRSSIASLLWQQLNHNRKALAILSLLIIVGVGCVPIQFTTFTLSSETTFVLGAATVLAALSVSWLGVMAFHGDGSSEAMRFLADRGVSPSQAWCGRHLVPFAILATSVLAYLLVQRVVIWQSPNVIGAWEVLPMPSALVMVIGLLTLYSVSQWTSQVMRLLAGTAFLAPLLGVLAARWLQSGWTGFGTPVWLLGVLSVVGLLATWSQMRSHMDGPRTRKFFVGHTAAVVAFLGLPYLWCWQETRSFPSVPASRLAEIEAASKEFAANVLPSVSMSRRETLYEQTIRTGATDYPVKEIVQALQAVGQRPEDWLQLPGTDRTPLRGDDQFVSQSLATCQLMQLRWVQSLDADDGPDTQSRDNFIAWVDGLTEMARRLRLSWRLVDQQSADKIEIRLTRMLGHPAVDRLSGNDVVKQAIAALADQSSRSQSRRRSVLLSWDKYHTDYVARARHGFGGLHLSSFYQSKPRVQAEWLFDDTVDAIASELLKLIDAGDRGESTRPARMQLQRLTLGDEVAFELSPYSDPLHSMDHQIYTGFPSAPASHWYAAWEDAAKKLSLPGKTASAQNLPSNEGASSDES